jgi:deoxyribodipyrimidine photo-lyase
LDRWKTGNTGFPVVDACMRQLNTTGYMHNRGRMIVAQFLVKTLLIDWREGERYFAQQLTDYDVASNYGNWASIVGGGAYSMPYFRVMNPWIQSEKFDRDTKYIRKWVPELKDVESKDIHKWSTAYKNAKYKDINYPAPMVDYHEQKEKALDLYNKYL